MKKSIFFIVALTCPLSMSAQSNTFKDALIEVAPSIQNMIPILKDSYKMALEYGLPHKDVVLNSYSIENNTMVMGVDVTAELFEKVISQNDDEQKNSAITCYLDAVANGIEAQLAILDGAEVDLKCNITSPDNQTCEITVSHSDIHLYVQGKQNDNANTIGSWIDTVNIKHPLIHRNVVVYSLENLKSSIEIICVTINTFDGLDKEAVSDTLLNALAVWMPEELLTADVMKTISMKLCNTDGVVTDTFSWNCGVVSALKRLDSEMDALSKSLDENKDIYYRKAREVADEFIKEFQQRYEANSKK